jgi:hypothetical protein
MKGLKDMYLKSYLPAVHLKNSKVEMDVINEWKKMVGMHQTDAKYRYSAPVTLSSLFTHLFSYLYLNLYLYMFLYLYHVHVRVRQQLMHLCAVQLCRTQPCYGITLFRCEEKTIGGKKLQPVLIVRLSLHYIIFFFFGFEILSSYMIIFDY